LRKLWQALKVILLCVLALVVVFVGVGLTLRAYRQHVLAKAMAIHMPNGIQEAMYVEIGGIDQWIQILNTPSCNNDCSGRGLK